MPRFFFSRFFGPASGGGGGGGGIPAAPTLTVADLGNGGGGTATIEGSDPGTTNTVYAHIYDPAFSIRPWIALGSCAGDGSVSFSLPAGHYAFYATSDLGGNQAISLVTYGPITDADRRSVLMRCCEAAAVRVRALGLPHLADQSIVVEDVPWSRLFEGDNPRLPMPGVLICPGGTDPSVVASNRRDDVGYPVLISITARSNQELERYLPRYSLWREMIARAFRAGKLPGVPEVISMRLEPGAIVVPDPFLRLVWHSAMVVRCTSREPRGLGA